MLHIHVRFWHSSSSVPHVAFAGGLTRGSRRERLLSKFIESEFEKIDRLMELYLRWVCEVVNYLGVSNRKECIFFMKDWLFSICLRLGLCFDLLS